MRILVTGAMGNVGRFVVESLLELGEKVVAASPNIEKLNKAYGGNENIRTVQFDFMEKKTYEAALEGVDRIFLMRPPHLGKPEDLLPFLHAMKKANIKLVAFLSLMGVENNPIPPHHKIEKLIQQLGIQYSFIRPGFFMQNLSGIHALEIKEKSQIFVPAGKSKTSFIDAKDIGFAAATILSSPEKHKNTAHTITGPESLDYYQVAAILSEVLRKKITYTKPSFLKYRHAYINRRGMDKSYVNVTVLLYFMTRMGTAEKVTHEFEKLTGRKQRSFREFALENIKTWQ